MPYQSVNPASGELLRRYTELTDPELEAKIVTLSEKVRNYEAPKTKKEPPRDLVQLKRKAADGTTVPTGALMDKSSDFVSISLSDQTISISGNVAVVRHTLAGATNDRGTPGNVTIKVLTIWQKDGGQWRLLARQAVRPA